MRMVTAVDLSCDSDVEACLDAPSNPLPDVSGESSKLEGEREAMTMAEALALNGHRAPTTPTNFPNFGPCAHQAPIWCETTQNVAARREQVGNHVEPGQGSRRTQKRKEQRKRKAVECANTDLKKARRM